jgi:xylan 1,4-beta-xylosidase
MKSAGADSVAPLESLAGKLAHHLERAAGPDGVLPAVLERDNAGFKSRILPAAEALVYPHYWLDCLLGRTADGSGELEPVIQQLRRALRGPWVDALRRHTVALLTDPQRRNLFDDGGIKLSSTSNNSWMSKIALLQYVTRQVLRLCDGHGDGSEAARLTNLFSTADAAHVRWQTEGISAFWACSDQMVKGVAKASRYYPRLITAALWLNEQARNTSAAPATPEPDVAAPLIP